MTHFDVFNGDADGICALHQLRLVHPLTSTLVTGVKRDTQLIDRLPAVANDCVTALDIGLKQNFQAVVKLLSAGVRFDWIDHHYPGEIPLDPAFRSQIDMAPDVCTSILVDRRIGGVHRPWTIAAAFGDGLSQTAYALANELRLSSDQTARLQRLGEVLNYNAYGETLADLWCDPATLYAELHTFIDPWKFCTESAQLAYIETGFEADILNAESVKPMVERAGCVVWLLPDQPWSRRVSGILASRLARSQPYRAHALITHASDGGHFRISVRIPEIGRTSVATRLNADSFCRQFPGGGGRATAAGINELPTGDLEKFVSAFSDEFS